MKERRETVDEWAEREGKNYNDLARLLGLSRQVVNYRKKEGWPVVTIGDYITMENPRMGNNG
jgi:hypothetical protein